MPEHSKHESLRRSLKTREQTAIQKKPENIPMSFLRAAERSVQSSVLCKEAKIITMILLLYDKNSRVLNSTRLFFDNGREVDK
jgi:hypothetical protein